jgi:hypothetical protein
LNVRLLAGSIPNETGGPTFMGLHLFLAGRFSREFVRTSFWQKDPLKGHFVLNDLPICSQLSFESAAIIAEYFSARKDAFVDLLSQPGDLRRTENLNYLRTLWDSKLREFRESPKNFSELLMDSERGRILSYFGIPMDAIKDNPDIVSNTYLEDRDRKVPVADFLPYLADKVILEAFGGGLHYPELIRTLWHNSYEVVPQEAEVSQMIKLGVLSPREGKNVLVPKPLKERQMQLIVSVGEYISRHFPDHLNLLT